MVDLQTAMAAAAADRQKRLDKTAADRKKRRSGADLGIERFDPVNHVAKEKAETASMWFVLAYAVVVALLNRHMLMGWVGAGEGFLLWFLPIGMLIFLPGLHRAVMPESFVEHYKPGTWVKAGFLHTFTFLAFSFLLVNPPFGDVTAASLDGAWDVAVIDADGTLVLASDSDDAVGMDGDGFSWTTEDGVLHGSAWVMFTLTDNHEVSENDVQVFVSSNAGSDKVEPVEVVPDAFTNLSRSDAEHRWFLVPIGDDLVEGRWTITVDIEEQGSPWVNTRVYEWHVDVIDERA
ncbi:MAG: hypothetical protein QF839_06295 [Candidatus Poseidoniaceae archaeon]|jgi:hypothetical protein|nr:hypothetical protein [Candidatus Poseidoniaceae archaeon]